MVTRRGSTWFGNDVLGRFVGNEGLRCVFLMMVTHGLLLVMGMNPLRGPSNCFMDGGCSWDLSLG